jgi:predicted DNA-binding protein (MmcQ/YjbR family)
MAHPRKYDDSHPAIKRLREICLALPGSYEKEAWGECTFRVTEGTMFAMTDNDHHHSGHLGVWIKAAHMVQEILVNSAPEIFFVPPYMGKQGWVGARLDGKADWEQVAGILRDGYEMSRPKKAGLSPESAPKKTIIRGATKGGVKVSPRLGGPGRKKSPLKPTPSGV